MFPKCYEEYETHVLIVETATLWMSGVMLPMTGKKARGRTDRHNKIMER